MSFKNNENILNTQYNDIYKAITNLYLLVMVHTKKTFILFTLCLSVFYLLHNGLNLSIFCFLCINKMPLNYFNIKGYLRNTNFCNCCYMWWNIFLSTL